jgi:hypothetical protein
MGGGRRLFGFECKVIVFMGAEAGVLIFMAIHEGREVGSTLHQVPVISVPNELN